MVGQFYITDAHQLHHFLTATYSFSSGHGKLIPLHAYFYLEAIYVEIVKEILSENGAYYCIGYAVAVFVIVAPVE